MIVRILLFAIIIVSYAHSYAFSEPQRVVHEDTNFFGSLTSISPITCENVRRKPGDKFDLLPCDLKEEISEPEEEVRKKEEPAAISQKRATPSSREEIMELYGSPEENEQVLAKEDAPRPIQAFYAALSIGDESLAREYARKAARYLHDLRETNERFSEFMNVEMTRPRVHDFDSLLADYVEQSGSNVDESSKQALASLIAEEHEKLSEGGSRKDELLLRMRYRETFRELNIPRSSDGRLEALLFLELDHAQAASAMKDFLNAALVENKQKKGAPRVTTRFYYLGNPSEELRQQFLNSFAVPLELVNGNGLGMEKYRGSGAALVVLSPTDETMHIEDGPRPQVFYEELFRYVRKSEESI